MKAPLAPSGAMAGPLARQLVHSSRPSGGQSAAEWPARVPKNNLPPDSTVLECEGKTANGSHGAAIGCVSATAGGGASACSSFTFHTTLTPGANIGCGNHAHLADKRLLSTGSDVEEN